MRYPLTITGRTARVFNDHGEVGVAMLVETQHKWPCEFESCLGGCTEAYRRCRQPAEASTEIGIDDDTDSYGAIEGAVWAVMLTLLALFAAAASWHLWSVIRQAVA